MKLKPPAKNPDINAFNPSSLFLIILKMHYIPFNKNVYNPINNPN